MAGSVVHGFALAIPGLGPVLANELDERDVDVTDSTGFDGRNDVVAFSLTASARWPRPRTAEDVFVEVGTAHHQHPRLSGLVGALVDPARLDGGRRVIGADRGKRAGTSFRVVARVLGEQHFLRTQFRNAVTAAVVQAKPRWREADPAPLELWAIESAPGRFRLGLRVTTSAHRQRGGRAVERAGALRPSVAAAMVRVAGPRSDAPLLDPCCGAGTVVAEAAAAGWEMVGFDLDGDALSAAAVNVRAATLARADVRSLPLGPGVVGAVAANLPFGRQFTVPGDPADWLTAALIEVARVVPSGAPVVLLMPGGSATTTALGRAPLIVRQRLDLRLLGVRTALWSLVAG